MEVAVNEGSWSTVGRWDAPNQGEGGGTGVGEEKQQEGETSHSIGVFAVARYVFTATVPDAVSVSS